jgi:acetyltransferase-like isoleucine patch superfamily enzyme
MAVTGNRLPAIKRLRERWQSKGTPEFLRMLWARAWMRFAGRTFAGRLATRLAGVCAPPHYSRQEMAEWNRKGYFAPNAVFHGSIRTGKNVFIDERALFHQSSTGGPIEVGDKVSVYRDAILQTGDGGTITVGPWTRIHPRCVLSAYVGSVRVGSDVGIAPNCAFYSYDHTIDPDKPIRTQGLESKGDIVVGDGAWLGFGVIVLAGVQIGDGAVIGAGSVVTRDIPAGAVAVGNPARVVRMRGDASRNMAHGTGEARL